MKTSELIKMLAKDDWFKTRQNGSHAIYKHNYKKGFLIVPVHPGKEIAKGTLESILKKAGLR